MSVSVFSHLHKLLNLIFSSSIFWVQCTVHYSTAQNNMVKWLYSSILHWSLFKWCFVEWMGWFMQILESVRENCWCNFSHHYCRRRHDTNHSLAICNVILVDGFCGSVTIHEEKNWFAIKISVASNWPGKLATIAFTHVKSSCIPYHLLMKWC